MSVELIGANPGLTLRGPDGARCAFASVWRVDWSPEGTGTALVLWYAGRLRVVSATPRLGGWLVERFTRHFPELDGLAYDAPELVAAPVTLDLEPAVAVSASGGGVELRVADPFDRRLVTAESFPGNGLRLSTVYSPCRTGRLVVDGEPVAGAPEVTDRSSEAFLADAEVWAGPT